MSEPNTNCQLCDKPFYARPWHLAHNQGKYCSYTCAYESKRTGQRFSCDKCSKEFYRNIAEIETKSGKHFCSMSCRASYNNALRVGENHPNWNKGTGSYRARAIREYGLKCNNGGNCPLKGINLPRFMYEADHIDSNHNNNKLENLQVLCVWCHRQKTIDDIVLNNPRHSVLISEQSL